MGTIKPLFHCSITELPIVCGTIVQSAVDNKEAITAKRPKYADPFFPDLLQRIQTDKDKYSGLDIAKDLRNSTVYLKSIMTPAKEDLSELYGNLNTDYKNEKGKLGEIKTTLGFNKFFTKVSRGNQEATIGLLDQINLNLTADLETDIITHGSSTGLLTRIKGYRSPLNNAELSQEGKKGKRPELTAEVISEFNSVYSDVIDLCTDCQRIFKNDKAKKDLFVFSKVLAALRGGSNGGINPPPPPPAN